MTDQLAPAYRGGGTAAVEHEESLLRHLYDQHAGPLLGFVIRLTNGDRQRAEDIVQETILRAWRNAHKLNVDGHHPMSLRPWLVTVARRIAVDTYRLDTARGREVYDRDLDLDGPLTPDTADAILDSIAMNEVLRTLSLAHREILVETYFTGRTVAEAARTLRIPLGTAKSRLYYALHALRDALERRGLMS